MSDRAQLEQDLSPLGCVLDSQLERGDEQSGRLVERECVGGRARREDAVVDRPAGVAERHRRREVIGQGRKGANRVARGGFPGLADSQVEVGPPDPREPVIDGTPDKLVGEPVGERRVLELLDEAATHRLIERRQELALRQSRSSADDLELERRTGGRGQLEQLGRRGRKPRQPLADHLAHAFGCIQLGQRRVDPRDCILRLDRPRLDERAPQLADEKRVAGG